MKNVLLIIAFSTGFFTFFTEEDKGFEIKFMSGEVLPEVTKDFSKVLDFDNSEINENYVYRVVQFYDIPSILEKQRMKAAGIELLSYIPNKAFHAKISTMLPNSILNNFNIRSLFPLEAYQKISPQLRQGELPSWAINGDDIILNVKYFSETDKDNFLEYLFKREWKVVGHLDETNLIVVQIPAADIKSLAEEPYVQWISPISPTNLPDNVAGKTSSRSNALNTSYITGRKYDGSGVAVASSDDGVVGPHIDLQGRVTMHTTVNDGNHGDMTSGILAGAANLDPTMIGMASGSDIHIFKQGLSIFVQSYEHLLNGIENYDDYGIVVTSTAYSQGQGGIYDYGADFVDQQVNENPQFFHVLSAGNSGTFDHGYGAGPGWANISGGIKASKSVICAGNVNGDDQLLVTSSRGPAADGRIKPDLCAQGQGQGSTDENYSYQVGSGTSASTPAIAGVVAQLYQAYKELNNGQEPESGLIKAALLNTARDLGNPGPDYKHGWGSMNGLKALRILEENRYLNGSIEQAGFNNHVISVPENVSQVRFMTYWTDVEGTIGASVALVNDINMQVITPGNEVRNPWILDSTPNASSLDAPATEGIDHLNNMEQVEINNPIAGDYNITIEGYAIPEGPQSYFVVYEFIYDGVELTYPIGGEGLVPGEVEHIRWDASVSSENFTLEYSIDGGVNFITISGAIPSTSRTYSWNVPNIVSSNVIVKISRDLHTSESHSAFTIVDIPQNLDFLRLCPDTIELTWNEVPGISMYEVSMLGEKYMDSLGVSTTNSITITGLNPLEEHWFSVRSIVDGGKGRRAIATYQAPEILNCNLNLDVAIDAILNDPSEYTPCGDSENIIVSVLIVNSGVNDVSDFDISYNLTSGNIVTENFSEILPSGEQVIYDFATPLELMETGLDTLFVSIDLEDDENEFNDEVSLEFVASLGSTTVPFMEDFESNMVPPENWIVTNGDNDLTWDVQNGITSIDGNSTTAAFVNNYSYNATGEEDVLTTEYFDLMVTNGSPFLRFDLAKAQYNANLNDGLRVEMSLDCGDSFITIYEKADLELSTLPSYNTTNEWQPESANDWRTELIDLSSYTGEVVYFRFININGYGNSTFIDNINIYIDEFVGLNEPTSMNFSIYPNPASESVWINLTERGDFGSSMMIYNSIGQVVLESDLHGITNKVVDASNFKPGLYFVVVQSNGISQTQKLILE